MMVHVVSNFSINFREKLDTFLDWTNISVFLILFSSFWCCLKSLKLFISCGQFSWLLVKVREMLKKVFVAVSFFSVLNVNYESHVSTQANFYIALFVECMVYMMQVFLTVPIICNHKIKTGASLSVPLLWTVLYLSLCLCLSVCVLCHAVVCKWKLHNIKFCGWAVITSVQWFTWLYATSFSSLWLDPAVLNCSYITCTEIYLKIIWCWPVCVWCDWSGFYQNINILSSSL